MSIRWNICVCLWLVSVAHAHVSTRVFPVYELPTADLPDIHDGSLEDWQDALGFATLTNGDFSGHPRLGGDPTATDDLAWQVYLAWHHDTGRIYVGLKRLDDSYLNGYDGSDVWTMFLHDATEFLVDGDHSGGAYQGNAIGRNDLLSHAQQYMALPTSPDGRNMVLWQAQNRPFAPEQTAWVTQPPFGDAGGRDIVGQPSQSILEFYVTPFDELVPDNAGQSRPSRLATGTILGLQLNVADFDVPGEGWSSFFSLGPADGAWNDADQFADAELIGCDILDCSGTRPSVVVTDSWGRVKAAFNDEVRSE